MNPPMWTLDNIAKVLVVLAVLVIVLLQVPKEALLYGGGAAFLLIIGYRIWIGSPVEDPDVFPNPNLYDESGRKYESSMNENEGEYRVKSRGGKTEG